MGAQLRIDGYKTVARSQGVVMQAVFVITMGRLEARP